MQIILVLFFMICAIHSEAQLRCVDLFRNDSLPARKIIDQIPNNQILSIEQIAQVVDYLNQQYGTMIISKSLVDHLQHVSDSPDSWEGVKHRRQKYKLSQILKSLHKPEDLDHYDLRNFAEKLLMLDFLSDESVTTGMSWREKFRYRQARQSLAYHGLAAVFLADKKISESTMNRFFNHIKSPFKFIYRQWHRINNGPLLPEDVAFRYLIQGLKENQTLLEPYNLKLIFQQWYDGSMTLMNRLLVGSMFVGITGFVFVNIGAIQERDAYQAASIRKAEAAFDPMIQFSTKMAETNKIEERYKVHYLKAVESFVAENNGAEPTEDQAKLIYQAVVLTQRIYFEINVPEQAANTNK